MIISYDKKFLFCHIPKTAGTSIAKALQPYTNTMEKHWLSQVSRKILGVNNVPHKMVNFQNYPHWSLLKASEILPQKTFENLYKFSFVRHPIQWQYSIYRHILRHSEIESFQKRYAFVYKNKSFDEYIRWRIDMGVIPQVLQLVNNSGDLLLNNVFHYERLNEDFNKLCKIININVKLPHANKNKTIAPVKINKLTEQLILDHYKIDFDVFGYDEQGVKSDFVFNSEQSFPELTGLIQQITPSSYDAWDINANKVNPQ